MKKINTKKAGLLYGLTLLSYTGFPRRGGNEE